MALGTVLRYKVSASGFLVRVIEACVLRSRRSCDLWIQRLCLLIVLGSLKKIHLAANMDNLIGGVEVLTIYDSRT
jgi:hypothetical protein